MNINPQVEIKNRTAAFQARYIGDLIKKGDYDPAYDYVPPQPLNKNPPKLTVATFDPAEYEITPVTFPVFKQYLKDKKLRWTCYKNEGSCPMCRRGAVDKELLKLLDAECAALLVNTPDANENTMAAARATKEYQALESKRIKILAAITRYEGHMIDLATARQYAFNKRSKMKVGDVFVTRDFVNHHDHEGGHVKCLILVLEFYEKAGGKLQVLKIRHYCSDAKSLTTNYGYMLDVWAYMLHPKDEQYPGFFDRFGTIYVGGDHGGHFASTATMIEESKFYRLYGKEIHLVFFSSYHAHGRADAAGAEDKR